MKHSQTSDNRSAARTAVYRLIVAVALLVAAAIILSIPVYYETMTLWYKTGIDKTMLKAGQYLGLVALLLIHLQVAISARGSILSSLFGPALLVRLHRLNGLFIAASACIHVLLVLVPEGMSNLPIGWKFWPEAVGAVLLLIIAATTLTSYFRNSIRLSYGLWQAVHKPAGYLVLALVTVHALFVSESFEHMVPRLLLAALFLLTVGTVLAAKFKGRRSLTGSSTHQQGGIDEH